MVATCCCPAARIARCRQLRSVACRNKRTGCTPVRLGEQRWQLQGEQRRSLVPSTPRRAVRLRSPSSDGRSGVVRCLPLLGPWPCISSGVSESVSGRAEAPRISGWSLVLAAGLAECGRLVLFDWFGSLAGSPIDGWFGVPDRAVGSSPGGDTTGCHRQSPAAFVDQVMMLLTQWQKVVDRSLAAVSEELDVVHLERLVSDTKRSRRQTSSRLVVNVWCVTPNVQ